VSIRDQFNDDEWYLLSATPAFIGAVMSAAEGSGIIGTVKELSASMRAAIGALKDYPDSELILTLQQKAENWDEAKEKLSDYRERSKAHLAEANIDSREALQTQVLKDISTCVALVDDHCSAEDARAYKQWSLKLANNVAAAAKEGGFLGFGGTRVSDGEKALLSQIEEALGVNSATDFA